MKIVKKVLAGLGVFVAVFVASAFIGWCSGFNFDHRNADVGVWIGVTLFAALIYGLVVAGQVK